MGTGDFDTVIVGAFGIFEYASVDDRFGIFTVDYFDVHVFGREPLYFLFNVDHADFFGDGCLVFT